MKISINKDHCIGCGVCEALCPEVFKLSDEGKSSVVEKYRTSSQEKGEVDEELVPCVKNAKESCPVEAIILE